MNDKIYSKQGYGNDHLPAFLDARDGDPYLSHKTQCIRLHPGKTGETPEQYITRILDKDPRFQAIVSPCAVVKGYSNGKWIFYCRIAEKTNI